MKAYIKCDQLGTNAHGRKLSALKIRMSEASRFSLRQPIEFLDEIP